MRLHKLGEATLIEGEATAVLRKFSADRFDSLVSDPPYELGFMNKGWDAQGIAFSVEFWREVFRVLKPGAHLLAFGGTRTYHRMTCAIEDAGFEIRDSLHWFYGTGFPKSLNVGEGRGTALKPGHEPIVMARKPLIGTVAANLAAHGTGALNVDGCRLGTTKNVPASVSRTDGVVFGSSLRNETGTESGHNPNVGRWPANVLLDQDAAAELDAQTSDLKKGGAIGMNTAAADTTRLTFGSDRRPRGVRYLVRLVTPAGGTVLDPFTGSGTTGMGALLEGFKFVGVEREPEYAAIAASRIGAVGCGPIPDSQGEAP